MGWIGEMASVIETLENAAADKDEEGRFLIRGAEIITLLGLGQEALVPDETEISIAGEWHPLCRMLKGGVRIAVF